VRALVKFQVPGLNLALTRTGNKDLVRKYVQIPLLGQERSFTLYIIELSCLFVLRTLRKKRTKRTQSGFTTAQESAQHFPRITDKRVDAKRAGHTLPFRNWPGTSSPKAGCAVAKLSSVLRAVLTPIRPHVDRTASAFGAFEPPAQRWYLDQSR
jgi:hypothetical protein